MDRPSKRRSDVLPYNLPPRGLSPEEAAAYVDISPSLVQQGKLPGPIQLGRRNRWDRWKIDEALARMSIEVEESSQLRKVEFAV